VSIIELIEEFVTAWITAVQFVVVFAVAAVTFLVLFVVRQNMKVSVSVQRGKRKRVFIDILLGVVGVVLVVIVVSYPVWVS